MMLVEVAVADAELVELARAGDGDAYRQLFDRHRDRVTAVCRQRLRDASDVDDAVQESFARALAKLHQLRDGDNFGPWIRSIAVRACTDHHRAAQRLVPVDDERHGETPDTAPLPDEMLLSAERDASLRATFDELGERDRRALWMRHVSEAPVAAVAMELGLTEGSTRVLLTRARHRLRAATTSLPALIPLSWRQWIRDHFPAATPALDALAVAVVLTLAGAGAVDATDTSRPADEVTPAAAVEQAEPTKAPNRERVQRRAGDRPAPTAAAPGGPDTRDGAEGAAAGRRGPVSRLGNAVQIRDEHPSSEETDELVDLDVFTDKDDVDEEHNNLRVYGRQVQPVVDAAQAAADGLTLGN